MASVTSKTIFAGLAQLVVAAYESQKPAVEAAITTGEVDLTTAVANALKNIPRPTGAFGFALAPIEAAIEQQINDYAANLVKQYGPDALYALIDLQLQAWAKQLSA